jgi:hypothetical protein
MTASVSNQEREDERPVERATDDEVRWGSATPIKYIRQLSTTNLDDMVDELLEFAREVRGEIPLKPGTWIGRRNLIDPEKETGAAAEEDDGSVL